MPGKNILAVDIGSDSIKLLYGRNGGGLKIEQAELIKTPDNTLLNGYIFGISSIYEAIKEFINAHDISPTGISFSIHSSDIMIKHIEIPEVGKGELDNVVNWVLNEYSFHSNYEMSYEISNRIINYDKKIYRVLIGFVPRKLIYCYEQLSNLLNLNIEHIDLASKCLLRIIRHNRIQTKDNGVLIIDFGQQSIRNILIRDNSIWAEKEIPISNYKITGERDNLKRILNSSELLIDYYYSVYNEEALERIYLTGGKAQTEEILWIVSDFFHTETQYMKLNKKISGINKFGSNQNIFMNALGLMIRKE